MTSDYTRTQVAEILRSYGHAFAAAELEVALPEEGTYRIGQVNGVLVCDPAYEKVLEETGTEDNYGRPWVVYYEVGKSTPNFYDWYGSGWEKT